MSNKTTVYLYRKTGASFGALAYLDAGKTISKEHHDERALRSIITSALECEGIMRDRIEFSTDAGEFVVKIVGAASGIASPADGQYLKRFDKSAAGGRGLLETTAQLDQAKVFYSRFAFFELWKNSSLKAFTIEITPRNNQEKVEVAGA